MDETSGELRDAVTAYLENRESLGQLRLVIDYCAYWIQAPCWRSPTDEPSDLEQLRQAVQRITTRQALSAWLTEALGLGIDPL